MIAWLSEHAGVVGLLFFFTFFSLTALWVYRPGSKAEYAAKAQIPLNED